MAKEATRDLHTVSESIKILKPARDLRVLHQDEFHYKMGGALGWGLILLLVSAALSLVTGSVLTRLMPDFLAYTVGATIHLAVGLSVHLWVVGRAQNDRQDKFVGALCFIFAMMSLAYIFIARANLLIYEGRSPWFAWTVSSFLCLVEAFVPALVGYILAKAWLDRNAAADEYRFYLHREQLIKSSANHTEAIARWKDAEDRLEDDIRGHYDSLDINQPEIDRLTRRLHTIREWNPFTNYNKDMDHAGHAKEVEVATVTRTFAVKNGSL